MGFEIRRENENVVHIHYHPSFIDLILEDMIHVQLEGGRRVAKTKEHDDRFVEAGGSDKCRLPSIIRVDKDIVISPSDINLGKVFGGAEFVKQWGNQWERVGILDRFGIEWTIILAGAKFSIFLSNEKESTCLRGFRGYNGSTSEMFFDKFFHSDLFGRSKLVGLNTFWFEIRF